MPTRVECAGQPPTLTSRLPSPPTLTIVPPPPPRNGSGCGGCEYGYCCCLEEEEGKSRF